MWMRWARYQINMVAELAMLQLPEHPNLLRMLACGTSRTAKYLVYPFIGGGDLFAFAPCWQTRSDAVLRDARGGIQGIRRFCWSFQLNGAYKHLSSIETSI